MHQIIRWDKSSPFFSSAISFLHCKSAIKEQLKQRALSAAGWKDVFFVGTVVVLSCVLL